MAAIAAVIREAFATPPFSRQTEHFVVHALRAAGALSLSLVAEVKGQVVGQVAFSPVTLSDGTPQWYGLEPVSVLPAYQGQGIGSALMREGLAHLRSTE